MEDGNLITLPVHLVRIANVMLSGEPLLEFNCKSVRDDLRQQGVKAQKDFIEDENLTVRLEGFPREVTDAVNSGHDWVQMYSGPLVKTTPSKNFVNKVTRVRAV